MLISPRSPPGQNKTNKQVKMTGENMKSECMAAANPAQYQISIWRSGYLIVKIFPSICFQKLRPLNNLERLPALIPGRKPPPSSSLSNSINLLQTL